MAEGSSYTVQQQRATGESDGRRPWVDLATVVVPKKTRAHTVLVTVLRDKGLRPTDLEGFRVLDADSARVIRVREKSSPEPEWEVVR